MNRSAVIKSSIGLYVIATMLCGRALAEPSCPIEMNFAVEGGESVQHDGDTALIGASPADAAYIFTFDGTDWSWLQTLEADDNPGGDGFGRQVALQSDVAVVGSRYHDHDGTDGSTQVGAAYVFRFDESTSIWNQKAELLPPDPVSNMDFAEALAVDGNVILVGADGDLGLAGSAYVFRSNGDDQNPGWALEQKLLADDFPNTGNFGQSVAVQGDTAFVGASLTSAVYVFTFDKISSMWVQTCKLTASDPTGVQRFGLSVAVSDDTLVIGDNLGETDGISAGAAYIFRLVESYWVQQDRLVPDLLEPGINFGIHVDVEGDLALVGARYEGAGTAYLFEENETEWAQKYKFAPSDGMTGDAFGTSVSLSGDIALVGATRGSGAAYAYMGVDPGIDCNGNGLSDTCDVINETSADCNANGSPDECDVATGFVYYTQDFESLIDPLDEWSNTITDVTPAGMRRFLGQFGAEAVTLTLNDLPPHTTATVSFDLFVIRSWDGNAPGSIPDIWDLSEASGGTLLHATFSNGNGEQSYPDAWPEGANPFGTGATEANTLGYDFPGIPFKDSVYHLSFAIEHTDTSLITVFSGIIDGPDLLNES